MLSAAIDVLQPYLAWLIALAVGVFAVRQTGKSSAKIKQLEKQLEQSEAIHETDNEMAKMDDDSVRNDLASFVRNKR